MPINENEISRFVNDLSRIINICARMYEGKGAELDDLIQEGYLAALLLMENRSPEALRHAIYTNLRGLVRHASKRLRRPDDTFQFSYFENPEDGASWVEKCVLDGWAADEAESIELNDALERCLDSGSWEIVEMLLSGFTHEDIGRELGITKQSATSRIERIRRKIQHIWETD